MVLGKGEALGLEESKELEADLRKTGLAKEEEAVLDEADIGGETAGVDGELPSGEERGGLESNEGRVGLRRRTESALERGRTERGRERRDGPSPFLRWPSSGRPRFQARAGNVCP